MVGHLAKVVNTFGNCKAVRKCLENSLHSYRMAYAFLGVMQKNPPNHVRAQMNHSARQSIFQALLLSAVAIANLCIRTELQGNDWPRFGGPTGNFQAVSSLGSKSLSIQPWRINIQAGDDSPVVLGNRVVLSQMDYASDGTDAHLISCFHLEDGRSLWQQSYPERSYLSQDISDRYPVRPVATSCIAKDKIIAVGYGGSIRCLNLSDGSSVWSVDPVKEYGAKPVQFGAATSPWSDGERVVVACGGDQALVLCFRIATGQLEWQAGAGSVSYASFVEFEIANEQGLQPKKHLVYAAGDEVIGFDPADGKVLWSYPLPNRGLTNAVTPIALATGQLLIGGQGVNGSTCLQVTASQDGNCIVDTKWTNNKIKPFYCNWVHHRASDLVIGFQGKTLFAMEPGSGRVLWEKRGWTDTNLTCIDNEIIAVRGDGVVAKIRIANDAPQILAASTVVRDRIWAPPTYVADRLLLRGRTSLSCLSLDSLEPCSSLPQGTEVTAMDAMYGNPTEVIATLRQKATDSPGNFSMRDYQQVVQDSSVTLGEGDCKFLLDSLEQVDNKELALAIAEDWTLRDPNSIAAFQSRVHLLQKLGRDALAQSIEKERMIEVRFEVSVPESTSSDQSVSVSGNATSLGDWKAEGLKLQRDQRGSYVGQALLPRGDLQFKLVSGSLENVEVRTDGRTTSNRRMRIQEPTTVRATVMGWKAKP